MLSMDIDQSSGKGLQEMERRELPIDVDAIPSGSGQDSSDDQIRFFVAEESGFTEAIG